MIVDAFKLTPVAANVSDKHEGLDRFDRLGYAAGYTWIAKYKHPFVKNALRPKAPMVFSRGKKDKDKDFAWRASENYKQGFVRGLNEYIEEHHLDLPKIKWTAREGITAEINGALVLIGNIYVLQS